MTLFHFTSLPHLEEIIRDGMLLPSESNIGTPWDDPQYPQGENAGPPVVHLMNTSSPFEFDHGLGGAHYDKRQARFEVNVPGIPWLSWEWTQMMSPRWQAIMEKRAGLGASAAWLVFPAPIRRRRWTSISVRDEEGDFLPEQYRAHLGAEDKDGYRPLSEALIEALAAATPVSVRPSR